MQIIKGKRIKPLAIMAYGLHGLGKSQFGSEFEKPIFVGSEENDELETDRFPRVKKWNELLEQLNYLVKNEHGYKTLVIDAIDTLEQIAQIEILSKAEKGKTMATAFGGYGKAYEKMADMFLDVREKYLVKLRDEKNMNIVILAHAEKNKHEDPLTMTSYDTYSTAIHKKIKPMFQDWVSAIFFITWRNFKVEGDDGKTRAIGDGQRIILTEERPSHIAKNRFELPEEIDYIKGETVKEIILMIQNFFGKSPKFEQPVNLVNQEVHAIQGEITDILKRITDDDIKSKIELSMQRADDDLTELKRIKTKAEKLAQ